MRSVLDRLFVLNRLRWPARLAAKGSLFALTVLFVCFPDPSRLIRHLRHWQDPNALVDPDLPELAPLAEELDGQLVGASSPRQVLDTVEKYVNQRIAYEWDWNTWGSVDYLPTLRETIEKGQEDCDGRAVVAASLLSRLGFRAELVTDFMHVWVKTEAGETMHPGKGKALIATDKGVQFQRGALLQLPRALAYGLAVFPRNRELIVVGVMWLLLLRRRGGLVCAGVGLTCFVGALLLLRWGGESHLKPAPAIQFLGIAAMLGGFVVMLIWARYHAAGGESRGTS